MTSTVLICKTLLRFFKIKEVDLKVHLSLHRLVSILLSCTKTWIHLVPFDNKHLLTSYNLEMLPDNFADVMCFHDEDLILYLHYELCAVQISSYTFKYETKGPRFKSRERNRGCALLMSLTLG